jgi:glycosyltransferase involved in cell wall biosynthesis
MSSATASIDSRGSETMMQPRCRVLFVNDSLHMGGIETMIRDFAIGISPQRFESCVAVFRGGGGLFDELSGKGTPVADLRKRDGLDPGLVWRLRRHIVAQRIDVVHSHNFAAWLYTVLATRGLPRVRLVHSEHSRVEPMWRRRATERWLAGRTHAVIGVSADVTRSLVADVGVDAKRAGLIANGIDLSRFRPDAAQRVAFRAGHGIPADALLFGIVARLVPVKDHASLVTAFGRVHAKESRARMVFAGDGPCRPELERQVVAAGLAAAVTFLGEVRQPQDVLRALDVYVLSSTSEGMNLTLLEAMATALPIVATAVGGNAEVVLDGRTGLLVPPSNPAALAEAMLRLAQDERCRADFGAQSRQRAEESYSQAATLRAYERLYLGGLPSQCGTA